MSDRSTPPIEIPWDQLSPEALRGLLEEFVTRDGTDYGREERTLASKLDDVRRLLERGEARVVFDPDTGTANVVVKT